MRTRKQPKDVPLARKKMAAATRKIAPVRKARAVRSEKRPAIHLTHPERMVFPGGHTKADVAEYYIAVMPQLLASIRGRPLSVIRCPDGIGGQCFFQKHVSAGLRHVTVVPIREQSGKTASYLCADSAEAVLELVQFNAIEFHPWAASARDPEHTDYLVFDLDPAPDVAWGRVVAAAGQVRERCLANGLRSFVRTTGGKGLHVVVPLRPAVPWSAAKDFARAFAEALATADADVFVAQAAKNRRSGRIFVDYLRNARGATSVASYSLRARAGAPVATPLSWEELNGIETPAELDLASVPQRLRRLRTDPWRGFRLLRQGLGASAPPRPA